MSGGYRIPLRCQWCRAKARVVQAVDLARVLVWLCPACVKENNDPKSKTRLAMAKSAAAFRARNAERP